MITSDYSDDVVPPAMILPISVAPLAGSAMGTVRALLDTGADITAIPDDLRREIGVKPAGYVRCSGALDDRPQTVPTYFVRLEIPEVDSVEVEVVSTPEQYLLLGRDVLNDFVLTAEGPARRFHLRTAEGEATD